MAKGIKNSTGLKVENLRNNVTDRMKWRKAIPMCHQKLETTRRNIERERER